MRRLLTTFAVALALQVRAQESQTAARQPDREALAVELLEQAHELTEQLPIEPRWQPLSFEAASIAELRKDLARQWATELFELAPQAKSAWSGLQGEAIRILVRVDPDHALELLHNTEAESARERANLRSPRISLTIQVFCSVIEHHGPGILPLLEQEADELGAQGRYPYAALAQATMEAMSSERINGNESRAAEIPQSVLETAFAKYQQTNHEHRDDLEFGDMLNVFAGTLPLESIRPPLRFFVKNLLSLDATQYDLQAWVRTKDGQKDVTDNTVDAAIMIYGSLINRDPELVQELVTAKPELKKILEYTEPSRYSSGGSGSWTSGMRTTADKTEQAQFAMKRDLYSEALTALHENDADRAISLLAEVMAPPNASDEVRELCSISAKAEVAEKLGHHDQIPALLERGFEIAKTLTRQPNRLGFTPGLGSLVQTGIRNSPALTTAFLQGLPFSIEKVRMFQAAADGLIMQMETDAVAKRNRQAASKM